MLIRRALIFCLITLSLTLTGPLARAFSSQVLQDPAAMVVTLAGAASNAGTAATSSKTCQRGAMAWSSCSPDLGFVPKLVQIGMANAGRALGRDPAQTATDLRDSRLFRPPRLS